MVSRNEWEEACKAVNTFTTHVHSISSKTNMLTMNQTQICLDNAWTKYEKTLEYVGTLEVDLDIQKRWMALNPEYQEIYQQSVHTKYSSALDELEVMHLFKLAKMNSSGIGTCFFLLYTYLMNDF